MSVEREVFRVPNGDGWELVLTRYADPARLRPETRPVVMVPGFAMNSFILGYHPRGTSLADYLAGRGLEVWSADLRGQGESRDLGGGRRFSLADVGLVDLAAAVEGVCDRSQVRADAVDAIGCSLGATYVFIQAAWWPGHRIARIVNMGGPMRWVAVHPFVRGLAAAPRAWGLVPLRGTRTLARRALPLISRVPGLLHIYLHPDICDLSQAHELTRTVDDPVPTINQEIARWIRAGDYVHEGRNLTEALTGLELPLLTIVANADGIVPEATVCSAHNVMTGPRQILYAGEESRPMAHADLFISDPAEARVFAPLADWLG